jgi:hypothetical protein
MLVGMRPVTLRVRLFETVPFCAFNKQGRHMINGPFCVSFRIRSLLLLYSFVPYLTALLLLLSYYVVIVSTYGMNTLSWIGKYVLESAVIHFKLLPRHLLRATERYQEASPTHMYNNRCFAHD